MCSRNRNLLALAVALALMAPAAWAEKQNAVATTSDQTTTAQTTTDQTTTTDQPTTQDTPQTGTQDLRSQGQTERTSNDAAASVDQMTPTSPPLSQGPARAAAHSSVVTRDLWNRLDTNRDGRISSTEGASDTEFNAGFSSYDSDGDGFVSETEYRVAAQNQLPRASATGGASAPSPQSSAAMRDVMSRLDANADGSISVSESAGDATFKSNFATIDSNSDGMVSDAEYRAWMKGNRK